MNRRQTIVIGAGIGGLTAAVDLARRGVEVTVLERAPEVGGKMRRVRVAERPVDAGPTVLTMRWVFEQLFDDAGVDFDAAVPTRAVDRLARHFWADGSTLDLHADAARSAEAIGAFAGPDAARGYREFLAYAQRIFAEVEGPFLRGPKPTLGSLVAARGARLVGSLRRIDSWRTVWSALGSYFPDPRLRQLFARYATYSGSSPFAAPATLNLIAHVEQAGVWVVEGGMHTLARALRDLAEANGATVRCGVEVVGLSVDRGRVSGVELASGERLTAASVIANTGPGALFGGLLGSAAERTVSRPGPRSLSAVTWCAAARPSGVPLDHHNVFFSTDYPAEFEAIFGRGALPETPTVYVCAQDRGAGPPPAGPEPMLCLVNAPAGPVDDAAVQAYETRTFEWLRRLGLKLEHAAPPVRTDPRDFAELFPGTGGALYGMASHGWRSSLQRPGAKTKLPGLFLAGGGVHPGAGVPMVALSGRLAAAAVLDP